MAIAIALTFGSFGNIAQLIQLILLSLLGACTLLVWRKDHRKLSHETDRAQRVLDLLPTNEVVANLPGSSVMMNMKEQLESDLLELKELIGAYESLPALKEDEEAAPEGNTGQGTTLAQSPEIIARIDRVLKIYRRESSLMLKWKGGSDKTKAKEIAAELTVKLQNIQLMAYLCSLGSMLTSIPGLSKGNSITLIDALGERKLVPFECCSTFKSFKWYLKRHFTARIGEQYVKQGDYTLSLNDTELHSELWENVKCSVEITMSVIIRIVKPSELDRARCPRCLAFNKSTSNRNMSFKCHNCEGHFRIEESKDSSRDPDMNTTQEMLYFRQIKVIFSPKKSRSILRARFTRLMKNWGPQPADTEPQPDVTPPPGKKHKRVVRNGTQSATLMSMLLQKINLKHRKSVS